MDRLTPQQIELLRAGLLASEWCGYVKRPMVNALCDLALQSLSQEAVREEAKDEQCWLIERFVNDHTEWFCGWYHTYYAKLESDWKRDAFKAVRFCRKEDAEAIMLGQESFFHLAKTASHIWFDPVRTPQARTECGTYGGAIRSLRCT
jgi:hypothetical protein